MTVEADLYTLLGALVSGRAYPDVAPTGTALPWITYQQVGGESVVFMESTLASKRNGRFQISVWATTRLESIALIRQAESAIVTNLKALPQGGAFADYEPETALYGARQFFSLWFDT